MTAYLLATAIFGCLYALFTLGLSVQWGMGGLLNFGHAAFFALGAYGTALLSMRGVPPALSVACAVGLAAGVGVLLGLTTLRLRAIYLGLVTLGFSELLRTFLMNEMWLTGGAVGIPGIPRLFAATGVRHDALYLALLVALLLVVYLCVRRLDRSPFGRVLASIREDEDVARSVGKNVFVFKVQALALGAGIAGLGGALFAHYITFVAPDQFVTALSLQAWVAVLLGGRGNHLGAVAGAFVLLAIQEGTRLLKDQIGFLDGEQLAALRILLVGVILVALMIFRPEGVLPRRARPTRRAPLEARHA
ncbi:MAG: branched-chain amino acid ABC transporter permease [Lautropia sp.]